MFIFAWIILDGKKSITYFVTTYIHDSFLMKKYFLRSRDFAGLPDAEKDGKSAKNYLLLQFLSDFHKILIECTSY